MLGILAGMVQKDSHVVCLHGHQHPCRGAEAFPWSRLCSWTSGRCRCDAYGHHDRCRDPNSAEHRLEVPQLQFIFKVFDFSVVAMRQIPVDSPAAVLMVVDVPVIAENCLGVPQMPFCVVGQMMAGMI